MSLEINGSISQNDWITDSLERDACYAASHKSVLQQNDLPLTQVNLSQQNRVRKITTRRLKQIIDHLIPSNPLIL